MAARLMSFKSPFPNQDTVAVVLEGAMAGIDTLSAK